MEEGVCNEGCIAVEWVAQGSGRYPIPGSIPGQAGSGSEHSDLVEDIHALPKEAGLK